MVQMSTLARNGCSISKKDQISLVLFLSIPAILEQLVGTAMSYIDAAMVGSIGYKATAAIGIVASSTWLVGGVTSSIALGFSVQVAHHLGAGREDKAKSVVRESLIFILLFGIIFALLCALVGFVLPSLLGADEDIKKSAAHYFQIYSLFIPFCMLEYTFSSHLRSAGNVIVPSLMYVVMCILDVVFNSFFIYETRYIGSIKVYGLGLGVEGAALGTGMSEAVSGIVLLILTIRFNRQLRLDDKGEWKLSSDCIKKMINIGLPTALERITISLAQVFMTAVVAAMGAISVAANYVAVQTEGICYLPAYGISSAATAMVGQSIGAGRKDLAKRFSAIAIVFGVLIVLLLSIFMFIYAPFLASFLTHEEEVIRLSAIVLRIVAFAEPLFALSIVIAGALRGAGDSRGPFYINSTTMWVIRVLSVIIYTKRFGLIGVWLSMSLELIARGLILLIRYLRGRWLDTSLKV